MDVRHIVPVVLILEQRFDRVLLQPPVPDDSLEPVDAGLRQGMSLEKLNGIAPLFDAFEE